jgi:hypothetical protein
MNPLTKLLQSRINRLAHRQALQHEQRIKAELMERLQNAREDGATFDDLTKMIDALEPPAALKDEDKHQEHKPTDCDVFQRNDPL